MATKWPIKLSIQNVRSAFWAVGVEKTAISGRHAQPTKIGNIGNLRPFPGTMAEKHLTNAEHDALVTASIGVQKSPYAA
jgi:hypothetical protein